MSETPPVSRVFLSKMSETPPVSRLFLSKMVETHPYLNHFLIFVINAPTLHSHHFAKCRLNMVDDYAPFILKLYEREDPATTYLVEPIDTIRPIAPRIIS